VIADPGARALHDLVATGRRDAWLTMALRFGKTFRSGKVVVTCEPEAVRALLMDRAHTEKRSRLHAAMRALPGADGLLFMDGEPWLRRLRALMPVFHHGHVDGFARYIHDTARAHAGRWSAAGELPDLYAAVVRLGAAIVLKVGYGLEPGGAVAERLADALVAYKAETMVEDPRRRLDDFGAGLGKVLDAPWIARTLLRMRRRMGRVEQAVREALAASDGGPRGADWLRGLREADLSVREIAREANHLYGAYNAIDYITTCGLYELSRHPEWASRLRAEWQRALPGRDVPAVEDFPALPDTVNVMREVLRMYPVSQTIARRVGAPLEIGGETHPEGTEVVILLYALHHHPDHWDHAERFDPERWKADPPPPRVPFAYVPFLDGPRKCIGRHMAELQFVVVLHAVLQAAEVSVTREEAPLTPFAVPRFAGPLPAVVRPRRA
jgi:cytochrome P450